MNGSAKKGQFLPFNVVEILLINLANNLIIICHPLAHAIATTATAIASASLSLSNF